MRRAHTLCLLTLLVVSVSIQVSLAGSTNASGGLSAGPLAISAISVEETNLFLKAIIPADLDEVVLEMRPALDAAWEEAGRLSTPAGQEEVAFRIPRPVSAMAFFRL